MSENSMEAKFLQGENLYLRPIMEKDIPSFVKWMNDPEVTQFLTLYLPMTEIDENEWYKHLSRNKDVNIVLAIVLNDGTLIGNIGIIGIKWKDRTATTGAVIGEKDCWGKGYGTEAKMMLLEYAFKTLNLRKICSSVLAFNERSLAYQMKCASKIEGRKVKQIYHNGEYHDEILLALFKEDFDEVWRLQKNKTL